MVQWNVVDHHCDLRREIVHIQNLVRLFWAICHGQVCTTSSCKLQKYLTERAAHRPWSESHDIIQFQWTHGIQIAVVADFPHVSMGRCVR
jgi:hypothetical protein